MPQKKYNKQKKPVNRDHKHSIAQEVLRLTVE